MRNITEREKEQVLEQVFDAMRLRWLDTSMAKGRKMNCQTSWYVKRPQRNHGGSRMVIGRNGNHVLVCPTCKQCYPTGQLVKCYAPDLAEALWGPGKGAISGRTRGKGANDADERKRWAQEQRKRFLSATGDSADPFGNRDGC